MEHNSDQSNLIENLPQILLPFGPNGSGKGTQTNILAERLNYNIVGLGESCREYTNKNHNSQIPEAFERAKKMNATMLSGGLVTINDLSFVVEYRINSEIETKSNVIIDGLGRSVEEANVFGKMLKGFATESCIVRIDLPLELAIERSSKRCFVKINNKEKMFACHEDALAEISKLGLGRSDIYRREDDNEQIVIERYNRTQSTIEEATKIYQELTRAKIVEVDGSLLVESVTQNIITGLRNLYGQNSANLNT